MRGRKKEEESFVLCDAVAERTNITTVEVGTVIVYIDCHNGYEMPIIEYKTDNLEANFSFRFSDSEKISQIVLLELLLK